MCKASADNGIRLFYFEGVPRAEEDRGSPVVSHKLTSKVGQEMLLDGNSLGCTSMAGGPLDAC